MALFFHLKIRKMYIFPIHSLPIHSVWQPHFPSTFPILLCHSKDPMVRASLPSLHPHLHPVSDINDPIQNNTLITLHMPSFYSQGKLNLHNLCFDITWYSVRNCICDVFVGTEPGGHHAWVWVEIFDVFTAPQAPLTPLTPLTSLRLWMFARSELGLAVVVGQGQHEDGGHANHCVQLGNHVSLLNLLIRQQHLMNWI